MKRSSDEIPADSKRPASSEERVRRAIHNAGSARPWKSRHVLGIDELQREDVEDVCVVAKTMQDMVEAQDACDLLKGKIIGNVFYEPSTRTRASFECAAYRLGAQVLNISTTGTSVKKGETLQDTMRCIECYTDALVLRHPEAGSVPRISKYLSKPLLNAGDGTREHPTQALLDAFTIKSERGSLDGIRIAMLGDLKYGRTVHSLARLLALFNDVRLYLVSPPSLVMPDSVLNQVKGKIRVSHHADLSDVIGEVDVLYVTRVQKERFPSLEEYSKVQGSFIVDAKTMEGAAAHMVVMHPLPRVGEIAEDVDTDERAAYFRQMRNGMFTRMALLGLTLASPSSSGEK